MPFNKNSARKKNYDQTRIGNFSRHHPYSSEDDEKILAKKQSDRELSKIIGRSVSAIQGRRTYLKHSLKGTRKNIHYRRLHWFAAHKDSVMWCAQYKCWTINWGSLLGKDMFKTLEEAIDAHMARSTDASV